MTEVEIKDRLGIILVELGVNEKYITADTNLFSDGILDSIVAIDYLVRIEEEFGVNITMPVIEEDKLGRLSSMTKYLETKMK